MTKRGSQRRRHFGTTNFMVPAQPRQEIVPRNEGIQVSSSDLPVPQEEYDADYAWVTERNGAVSLFFAKGDAGRDGLVSRVEIRYAYEAFIGHYWAGSREFHEQLRRQFANSPLLQRTDREHRRPEAASPVKQASLWANLDFISRTGTSASLDFYHLPPAAVLQFLRTGDRRKLSIDPRLRVVTTVFELLRLLDSSEPLVRDLEPLLGGLLQERDENRDEDRDAER